jgi:hypothetical protein
MFGAAAVAGALPDLVRETALTGDPIFPIAGGLFHSAFWAPTLEQVNQASIHAFGADTSPAVLFQLPWVLTTQADRYRNLIGPLLLFVLPFLVAAACLRRTHPFFRLFALYVALWTVLWFVTGTIEARYAECIFPVVTILAAFVALPNAKNGLFANGVVRGLFLASLLCISVLNAQFFVPYQRGATLGQVSGYIKFLWPYLYDNLPTRNVQLVWYPTIEYINAHLDPQKDKVYFATLDGFLNLYIDVPIFDGVSPTGKLLRDWDIFSPAAYDRLTERGVDYVVIGDGFEPRLKRSPLYRHLSEVARFPVTPAPGGQPGGSEILYRLQ